jgi:hypothetical protein
MFADTLLVKNLNNPDYMKVILDRNMSLEEKFAEIDHEQVIARIKDAGNDENKIPRKIKNMIRENKTMDKILYLRAV